MTENKDKHSDKEKDKHNSSSDQDQRPHDKDKEPHDRPNVFSQLMDAMTMTGSKSSSRGHSVSSAASTSSSASAPTNDVNLLSPFYGVGSSSYHSELLLLDVAAGEFRIFNERNSQREETFGTQRVYKKNSPNCVLTMYLPSREITLCGNNSSVLRGIVFVDPKAIQGYRVYAQLTLTFRYGREDEEVMGLRFCNEAIMSLHQVWPRKEEPARESLSPLQDALVKRLGDGAHPFTLTLTPQAPPSVQLVPAKRYYGAPIGTSYDVRCFIADKTDEKFHRRASVKMGVRVIYRTNVFHSNGPENFAALVNNQQQTASPPLAGIQATATTSQSPIVTHSTCTSNSNSHQNSQQSLQEATTGITASSTGVINVGGSNELSLCSKPIDVNQTTAGASSTATAAATATTAPTAAAAAAATSTTTATATTSTACVKSRKSERGESFPKLRLSPKSFRFSGRFGRSKSEIEKCPNDPFYNYSKSFQEYDSISGGGPQGAVDKPFLLQDGRVGLRASLDKAWYTHGEDVCVTVNIRNDSRKTVRKIRVCAIQHVDVCMFNNGKFKNVVADSDSHSPVDRTVPAGGTLNTTIVLRPQRGPTKNWIALEDTLQRSTEPEDITGSIAASAIRSPMVLAAIQGTPQPSPSAVACCLQQQQHHPVALSPAAYQQQQHSALATAVAALQHQQHPSHHHHHGEDRNVFAIYVSYYVKVKLTLSGMGGELSLKLPFVLVHVDESERQQQRLTQEAMHKLALDDVPLAAKKNCAQKQLVGSKGGAAQQQNTRHLDSIESNDDDFNIKITVPVTRTTTTLTTTKKTNNNNSSSHSTSSSTGSSNNNHKKRKLIRSETIATDYDEEANDVGDDDDDVEEDVIDEELDEASNQLKGSDTQAAATTAQSKTTAATSKATTSGNSSSKIQDNSMTSSIEVENVHIVQIHSQGVKEEEQEEVQELKNETAVDEAQSQHQQQSTEADMTGKAEEVVAASVRPKAATQHLINDEIQAEHDFDV